MVAAFTQKRAGFDAAGYFGEGKREELKALCAETNADAVLVEIVESSRDNKAKGGVLFSER